MADRNGIDRGVLIRNFGAVLTALVSVIAIGFGFLQFYLEEKRRELENQIDFERRAMESQIAAERSERAWKLALTQFATENYDQIFADDEAKRARLEALMKATFPDDLLKGFYEQQVREATTFRQVAQSSEAFASISETPTPPRAAAQATVYLQYADAQDLEKVSRFLETLSVEGFRTPGRELVTKFDFKAGVRYFHDSDKAEAERVLDELTDFLEAFGRHAPEEPKNLAQAYPNVPQGIIEIWVPKLSGD